MILAHSLEELRIAVGVSRRSGGVIGFVPTMGFLHEGHLSLVDVARDAGATFVVVSSFTCVTPLRSRRSMKMMPPWSRMVSTQPASDTDAPRSAEVSWAQ